MKLATSLLLAILFQPLSGCTAPDGFGHLLRTVHRGGLSVQVEGHLGPSEVRIYSIQVDVAEEGSDLLLSGGICRLFEDLDGDTIFDPAVDRAIGTLEIDAPPHTPWIAGPLTGAFGKGDPCLSTSVTVSDGSERTQTFLIDLE